LVQPSPSRELGAVIAIGAASAYAGSEKVQASLDGMMHVQLPVSKEITLSDAVTAFVYGEPCDPPSGLFHSHKLDVLLKRLYRAARAGQISFRTLKVGKNNRYQEIKPSYFKRYRFEWSKNQIEHLVPYNNPEDPEYSQKYAVAWDDVHLDREQFASFLREMGVTVLQNLGPGAPQNVDAEAPADLSDLETSGTGLAGRPESVQFVLPMAKKRLDAKDYPDSKTEFAKQLAKDFAEAAPKAHHPKPNSIRNNPEFSEMWRRKPPKDPS
jgi:hypothetical protein